MATLIKKMDLTLLFPENLYLVKDFMPKYKYEQGKRTENLEGWTYTLVEMERFEILKVQIKNIKPLFTKEEWQEVEDTGAKIFVQLNKAWIHPYLNYNTKTIEDSIIAESIEIVKKQ